MGLQYAGGRETREVSLMLFADDTAVMTDSREKLQKLVSEFKSCA